ncbi:MAG: LysR family transcriptional regulator [Burkholderiaceae bacterium]|nr:LysR family transcriptional regulator [Burkholderiaceae bacterium]
MTQPPLSRQIAMLEERLGVRLFDRDRRSVRITPAGRFFVPEAREILRRAEDSAAETRLAAAGVLGTIAIGFTATASYDLLPRLVGLHHARYPGVGFVFKELLIEEQLRLLGTGSLDIAIVRPPVDAQRFDGITVMRDHWSVAVPASHALARGKTIAIRHLHDAPYIAWSPISKYFHVIQERLFEESGVVPRRVVSMPQPPAILAMVRAGLGLALVPGGMAGHGLAGVALRRLTAPAVDPALLCLESVLTWRRDNQEAAVQRFLATARELEVGAAESRRGAQVKSAVRSRQRAISTGPSTSKPLRPGRAR